MTVADFDERGRVIGKIMQGWMQAERGDGQGAMARGDDGGVGMVRSSRISPKVEEMLGFMGRKKEMIKCYDEIDIL